MSNPKNRTIIARNKDNSLYKLFSGKVISRKKIVKHIRKGYHYYDIEGVKIATVYVKGVVYLRSVANDTKTDNLQNLPVTDLKPLRNLRFSYRKRGTIIAQNHEHSLFKLYSGKVVTKEHIVKRINKGYKYHDLRNAEISYVTMAQGNFLRSKADGRISNNLGNVPVVELSLQQLSHAGKDKGASWIVLPFLLIGTALAVAMPLTYCNKAPVVPPQPSGTDLSTIITQTDLGYILKNESGDKNKILEIINTKNNLSLTISDVSIENVVFDNSIGNAEIRGNGNGYYGQVLISWRVIWKKISDLKTGDNLSNKYVVFNSTSLPTQNVNFSNAALFYATSATSSNDRMMGFTNQGTPIFSCATFSSPTGISILWNGSRWLIFGFTQLSLTLSIYYYQLVDFTNILVMNPVLNQIQKDIANAFMILDTAPTI